VGLTNLPCKNENCWEASKKFSRIMWRRPRPKLGCGAKERRRRKLSGEFDYGSIWSLLYTYTKSNLQMIWKTAHRAQNWCIIWNKEFL